MRKIGEKNRKTILQYVLLWIAFMNHNSLLVHNHKTIFTVIGLGICFIAIILYTAILEKKVIIFLSFLLCNIIFVRLINNGGIGLSIFFHWTLEILSICLANKMDEKKFFERFVAVIAFYATVSIVCTFIYKFIPHVWTQIMPTTYLVGQTSKMPFEGILYIHNISEYGDKLGRNLGVFTEPGLYQIPLNAALYVVLLLREKLSYSYKKKNCIALILMIAILLAKSTTGYIAMVSIVAVAILTSKTQLKAKLILIIMFGIIIVFFDYILRAEDSIIFTVLINKLFDSSGFNLSAGSGKWRILTIEYALEVAKKYPLGAGYDNYNNYILSCGQRLYELVGVESIKAFAYYGIVQMIIIYLWILKIAYDNKKNIMTYLLIIFLYINSTFAQSDIFYPSFIALLFINQKVKCESRVEKGFS